MMAKGLQLSVVLLLASATAAKAQAVVQPPPPESAPVHTEESFWSVPGVDPEPGSQERVWLKGEYLLWSIRNGPLSTPLVTTGSAQDALPGAIGQSGTHVLFGDRPLDFGAFSGIRITAGFDCLDGLGVEVGYFALERCTASYSAVSDGNGSPVIARPVFDSQGHAENAYLYALPDTAFGSVAVLAHSRLQGGELNLTACIFATPSMTVKFLAGFRSLELNEDLTIDGNVTPLVPGFLTFLGQQADPPSTLIDHDSFKTRNQFYGGQMGCQIGWRTDRFSLDLLGKLALGSTQQLVFIDGLSTVNVPDNSSSNPGGLLAQPSNMGRHYHSSFGIIPEIGLTAGCQLTQQFKATIGYNFLYWNRVARPGDQIDRSVAPGQVARDPNFDSSTENLRPMFQMHETGFWAQGLTAGLEFQY
jgi:Putative beta barrel porin-7 (BBP7)